MVRSLRATAIVMLIALCGCASLQQSVGGWFGDDTAAAPDAAAAQGQVYYVGAESLPIFAEPSAGAALIGHYPLHEKVTRTRVEHGYAYVTPERGGTSGWVNNAQLIWRLPAAAGGTVRPAGEQGSTLPGASAAPAAEQGAEGPAHADTIEPTPAAAAPADTPAVAPTATSIPATPAAASTGGADPPATPARQRQEPSMFDPF